MNTVVAIHHKSLGSKAPVINNINPHAIPRKGDKVDMGFNPAPEVKDVIWKYETHQTTVFVIVD